MTTKPSYLGVLNAIAVGEARGEQLLGTWADNTQDAELAQVLRTVAVREREHAAAFAKRISELGFAVRARKDEDFDARLACACGDHDDLERFDVLLGYDSSANATRGLHKLFKDHSIDAQTGALLGRFIAEERDSERMLRAEHERVRAARESAASAAATAPEPGAGLDRTQALDRRLERLEAQICQLRDFLDHRSGT